MSDEYLSRPRRFGKSLLLDTIAEVFTGYLTVKEVIQTRGSPIYALDIPNFEVRDAFSQKNRQPQIKS
ncbi:MAG: AAA family ATPase [Oscillospiraceae bacterium]|nr:AAA family ATPase [Oscillospiraceae bacterium]